MRFGGQVLTGALIGLSVCVWLTLTQPRRGDELGVQHTPAPAPGRLTTYTPSPLVAVTGQHVVNLQPYGVTVTAVDPVADLVYGQINDGTNTWVGLATTSLLAKYPACKAGALGTLMRTKAPSPSFTPTPNPSFTPYPTRTPSGQPFKKTVSGYLYTYRPSYSTCATDQSGRDTLAADRAAVVNAVLPTLAP